MRQTTTPKERMQEVINLLGISVSEFEKRCGLGSGFVARLTRNITRRSRMKIKEVFPKVNMEYVSINRGKPFEQEKAPMPTMKERILQFCKMMDITEKEFCRSSGLSTSFVANMSDNVRKSSLERINNHYPQLNLEWLQTGRGAMILQKPQKINAPKGKTASRIREVIKHLGLTIAEFERETGVSQMTIKHSDNITVDKVEKITGRYPHINPQWLMFGTGEMITDTSNINLAPLVGQRDYRDYAKDTGDKFLSTLKVIPCNLPKDADTVAFEVAGDAMDNGTYESYLNGDVVICREVIDEQTTERDDYVVVTKDNVLIRRIRKTDKGYDLHALNRNYPTVSVKSPKKLFVVLLRITKMH